jgi:hypothetical protein
MEKYEEDTWNPRAPLDGGFFLFHDDQLFSVARGKNNVPEFAIHHDRSATL